MTVTRRASTLCPRDKGRTVAGEATSGAPFRGVLTDSAFAGDHRILWIGRDLIEIHSDTWVRVTGAVEVTEN